MLFFCELHRSTWLIRTIFFSEARIETLCCPLTCLNVFRMNIFLRALINDYVCLGLPRILEAIENYWQLFGESVPYWEPSPMLVKLVKHYGNPHISQWMNLHHKVIQSSL